MTRLPDDPRLPPHARGTLVAAALLIAVSVLSYAVSAYQVRGVTTPALIPLAHAIIALLMMAVILRVRRLTLARVAIMEVLLITPLYAEVWMRHAWLIDYGEPFAPFQGLKLLLVALAVVVPAPVWMHVAWLAGFGVLTFVIWQHIQLAGLPMAAEEPWFTMVFFVASFGLLLYRWHSQTLTRRLLVAEARSRAFASVARLFLRLRDETNTPLQNLRLGIEIVAQRHPEHADLMARMRVAVNRLEAVRSTLGRYDHLIAWDGSELHADPELEALLVELEKEEKVETASPPPADK